MTHSDLDKTTLKELQGKLEEERDTLSKELKNIGRVNPNNPKDWEATPQKLDIQEADRNEAADRIEGFEENTAILKELETRYNNVMGALDRMEKNTYGTCEIGHEPIALDRLRANPAASTCMKHMPESE